MLYPITDKHHLTSLSHIFLLFCTNVSQLCLRHYGLIKVKVFSTVIAVIDVLQLLLCLVMHFFWFALAHIEMIMTTLSFFRTLLLLIMDGFPELLNRDHTLLQFVLGIMFMSL